MLRELNSPDELVDNGMDDCTIGRFFAFRLPEWIPIAAQAVIPNPLQIIFGLGLITDAHAPAFQ
jgi:hypothetical protein